MKSKHGGDEDVKGSQEQPASKQASSEEEEVRGVESDEK